jgi:diadenosine tetraphosphate (Ap4A) HIT family hydrolase
VPKDLRDTIPPGRDSPRRPSLICAKAEGVGHQRVMHNAGSLAAERAARLESDGEDCSLSGLEDDDTPAMDVCPFCARIQAQVDSGSDAAVAFPDEFPLSAGHTLIVPRRHIARLEELRLSEWLDLFALVRTIARDLSSLPDVNGVNVGLNSGRAAGQTVDHAHVHVIPRRFGDVADPRGGVRWVIPDRASYWSERG